MEYILVKKEVKKVSFKKVQKLNKLSNNHPAWKKGDNNIFEIPALNALINFKKLPPPSPARDLISQSIESFVDCSTTQPAFTCSKLTIETLEQVWNMFKVNNKDTRTMPGVFIVNFEHISHLVLVFLLLTLNK